VLFFVGELGCEKYLWLDFWRGDRDEEKEEEEEEG